MFMNATSLRVILVSEKPFLLNYFPVIYTYMRVRQKTQRIKYIKFVLLHVLITKMNARQCSKRVNIPGAGAGLSKKEEEEEEE